MDATAATEPLNPVLLDAPPASASMGALFGVDAAPANAARWLALTAISAAVLAGLAIGAVLYFARPIVLPMAGAFILSALLAPIANGLSRLGLPDPASGGVAVAFALAALVFAVMAIDRPAIAWFQRMPVIIDEAQSKLANVSVAMTQMRAATKEVEDKITNITEDDAASAEPQEVVVRENSALGAVAKSARSAIVQIMLTFVMAYFFLATRTSFRIKAMAAQPTLRGKLQVARLFRDINGKVGEYILTMTVINAGLAAAMTAAMMAIGMPSPLVWGVLAGVLNFVPYVGPVIITGLLAMAGLVTFDSPQAALLPAAIYILFNFLESNVVTPSVIGVRMMISPLAVIVAIAIFAWMWGPVGAVLAIPLLVVIKAVCDSIGFLKPIGVLLGEIQDIKGRKLGFCRIEPIARGRRHAGAAAVERHIADYRRRTSAPPIRQRLYGTKSAPTPKVAVSIHPMRQDSSSDVRVRPIL